MKHEILEKQWAVLIEALRHENCIISSDFSDTCDHIVFQDEKGKQYKWSFNRTIPCINLEHYHKK